MSKGKQLVQSSKLKDSGPESAFNTFLETDSVVSPHDHFFVIKVAQAFFCKGGRYQNFPYVFMVQNPKLSTFSEMFCGCRIFKIYRGKTVR